MTRGWPSLLGRVGLFAALIGYAHTALPGMADVRTDPPAAIDGLESKTAFPIGVPVREDLNRIAEAVEGVESDHGQNPAMWRPDLDGPQGPMQVSRAAAIAVGDGNRFDMTSNRALGRAFLDLMYRRYGNWPDALAAYNWGPARVDAWIGAGRRDDRIPASVTEYIRRVLIDSGHRQDRYRATGDASTFRDPGGPPYAGTTAAGRPAPGSLMAFPTASGEEPGRPADRSLGVSSLAYHGWQARERQVRHDPLGSSASRLPRRGWGDDQE